MEILHLAILPELEEKLVDHLTSSLIFDYVNNSPGVHILAVEEFFLRTNSYQMNMIVIKLVNTEMHIDLVGVGGGTGFLGLDWGSEKAFAKKTRHLLKEFCNSNGTTLKVLE